MLDVLYVFVVLPLMAVVWSRIIWSSEWHAYKARRARLGLGANWVDFLGSANPSPWQGSPTPVEMTALHLKQRRGELRGTLRRLVIFLAATTLSAIPVWALLRWIIRCLLQG